MFKYAIKKDITRKCYERRLKIFFDFIEFETTRLSREVRCNKFSEKSKNNSNWTKSNN
jgi:hypothetical protein